ncbi:DUF58 domain-containing protein [Aneurinibacillus tyrosinisolvens]|uniref:DUF58 domain-containing protein n=1 Tax=Aneurinibacillus tyrosinisolvens TaxID=1443435 RepID=UPI00063EDABF|nr:DUF58 domain-containing protein [Aneurinibacillus tyrosinisolvens]
MSTEQPLLEPDFLRRLERMCVAGKQAMRGTQAGKRRSRNLGSSIEFADYRSYTPGDDLRQLDWNAYARLGKLFLKTYLDEQEVHVSFYIDCSKSMAFGSPSKFHRAVQLVAALGYLSLHHFDRISVYAFDSGIRAALPSLLGKGKTHRLFPFLASLKPEGTGNLNEALFGGRAVHGKPGISLIFSDFLYENGYEKGVNYIQAARQEVSLVHLLAEEERTPAMQGDLRLVDSETQSKTEVAVSQALLHTYERSLREFRQGMADYAHRRGLTYIDVRPEASIEEIIFQVFQQAGLVR